VLDPASGGRHGLTCDALLARLKVLIQLWPLAPRSASSCAVTASGL
jgi:hypothetical protein